MKKKKKRSIRGRKSRAAGRRFELKVRNHLQKEKGWIVDKWSNNVDLKKGELVKVKNKFLGPGKPIMLGAGFPDVIAFKKNGGDDNYEIIGVEVKGNGYLKKVERKKCRWLLKNNIFSKIFIASKHKDSNDRRRTLIKYTDFKDKYPSQ